MIKFIVHTDTYSGNFTRQLCAYVTGHLRECERGHEYVKSETTEIFRGYVETVTDDRNTHTPVLIHINPSMTNVSGMIFDPKDKDQLNLAIEKGIEGIRDYDLNPAMERLAFYKGTKYQYIDRIKKEIVGIGKKIEKYKTAHDVPSGRAYASVCIFFKDNIPQHKLEIAKTLAGEFFEKDEFDEIKMQNIEIVRDVEVGTDGVEEIYNNPPHDVIESELVDKTIEFKDVVFEPRIEVRQCNSNKAEYKVSITLHECNYFEKIRVLNAPDGCVKVYDGCDGYRTTVTIEDEGKNVINQKLAEIFGQEYTLPKRGKDSLMFSVMKDSMTKAGSKDVSDEAVLEIIDEFFSPKEFTHHIPESDLMMCVNRFYMAGFDNNIAHPSMDYFRLSYRLTVTEFIGKLDEVISNKKLFDIVVKNIKR